MTNSITNPELTKNLFAALWFRHSSLNVLFQMEDQFTDEGFYEMVQDAISELETASIAYLNHITALELDLSSNDDFFNFIHNTSNFRNTETGWFIQNLTQFAI